MNEKETLTIKQRLFIDHYLGDAKFNATKAAILAGYSEKTATAIGSENLRKPDIRARIEEILESEGINSHRTISELSDIAYSEWREHVQIVYDSDGNEKDAIIVLRDKVRALELLGKVQGLMIDKHELTGKGGAPLEVTNVIRPKIDDGSSDS